MEFESSVIPYGSQTTAKNIKITTQFESSVIPYGIQTINIMCMDCNEFESSVILYNLQSQENKKAAKPFCNDLAAFIWSQLTDSNPRPADYKSAALPTVLNWQWGYYTAFSSFCQCLSARAFCRRAKSSRLSCSGRAFSLMPAAASASITLALGRQRPAAMLLAAVLRRWQNAARTKAK